MYAKIKCNTCGFMLKKAGVVKRTPLDKLDNGEFIVVKVEPCPVCLEHKYKHGKAIAKRKPSRGK